MVEIFTKRSELMPSDESIEQHTKKRSEEIADVDRDRSGPDGLFKGTFPAKRGELFYDESDGVLRCRGCGHEHEGGAICQHCGDEFDEEDLYNFSDVDDEHDLEDLDELELDLEGEFADGHHHFLGMPGFGFPHHHFHHHHHHHDDVTETSNSDGSAMNSESDEEDGGSLQDFVVPDDDEHPPPREPNAGQSQRQTITISDDESDEGGAVSNRRRRRANWRSRRASPAIHSVLTVTDDSTNGSEAGDHNSEAEMLRHAGWSPLDQGNDSDADDHAQYGYGGYVATEDEQHTDDESDTETMIGGGGSGDEDEERSGDDLSATPRYDHPDFPAHAGHIPHSYASEDDADDDDSEVGLSTDRDGDTEMSVSPGASRAGRSVSISTNGYGYDIDDPSRSSRGMSLRTNGGGYDVGEGYDLSRQSRSTSMSTNGGYGYEMGEDLGGANHIHEIEDESDNSEIRPPPRRLPRRYHPNTRVQQYDPRISMIFAEHQQSMRGSQDERLGLDELDGEVRRVEPASRTRRMTAYRVLPQRRADPLRSSRSPSATRVIPSSSNRAARAPRQYLRRAHN